MNYAEALDYLLSFNDMERGYIRQASTNPTMSLASMRSLLGRLNDPHLGRATVHITGSKGKGSTAAMIARILEQNDNLTALYTSPHLHSFTERITIDGMAVSTEEFAAALSAIKPHIEAEQESVHGAISTFGVLTALFFWLVRAQVRGVNWQVVEVGLGGSFDATNVFSTPEVIVITPISLEHTAILGKTTLEIATDKAGLIKPGCHVVLSPQRDPAVRDFIRGRCDSLGAILVDVSESYDCEPLEKFPWGQSFVLRGPGTTREMRTPMLGRHQLSNALTAVAVAEAIRARGFHISDTAITEGVARARLPGRMEVMGQKPVIIADGAHNGESAAALADTLRNYFEFKRCFFVLGMAQDKDPQAIGKQLAPLADMICCTGYTSARAMNAETMAQELASLGPPVTSDDTVKAAIDRALAQAGPDDLVCITGSLYVVAEARTHILGESVTSE